MTTTTETRSIKVDAPVEKVFSFVADPEKRLRTFPGRRTVVDEVETSPDGVVKRYTSTSRFGPLPMHFEGTPQQVTNERIVDGTDTWTFEPSRTGTTLTLTGRMSTPIPMMDKVMLFVATNGKGMAHTIEEWLAEIKRQVEAES